MLASENNSDPSLALLLQDPARTLWELDRLACEDHLSEFVRQAWHVIEPGMQYVHGWHLDAICMHLEAVSNGEDIDGALFNRLLVNVPPGMMKSLLLNVFWPAWEWGPLGRPHLRYVCASHSLELAVRDSTRMRRLICSEWYQERWGGTVILTGDQNQKTKFENTAGGFRQAVAARSITGARGDRVLIDDPHSVGGAASEAERKSTIDWFLEAVPTRLNDPIRSAIIVIMQRLHEEDVSGVILSKGLGYEHLCLPMRYDPSRHCSTGIGFEDPRTDPGELLFEERFPESVVRRDELVMGSYATAGQFQQSPVPRGGGILKRDWWGVWDASMAKSMGLRDNQFPPCVYVCASLDTAYTEKTSNDPSALTVFGIWRDKAGMPKAMLMSAWAERLELHDHEVVVRNGVTKEIRTGLVEKVIATCRRFKVDRLLIEAKATGITVAQEIRRLCRDETWSVQLIDPGRLDKTARAYQVQPMFEQGCIYAPVREWADMVIDQCASFPKAKHDDLVDTVTQALNHFRVANMLMLPGEVQADLAASLTHSTSERVQPLYPG